MALPGNQPDEWLAALEAAKLLARRFGGLTIAKQAIALGLREGLLRARAEWAVHVKEGEEELTELDATPEQPIEIPPEVWCASVNWESDRLGWDWESGCFEVEGHFVEDDWTYGGVSLLKSDIETVDPNAQPYSAVVQDRAPARTAMEDVRVRRTTTARVWDWEPALAELVALADYDPLEEVLKTPFGRGFQARLEEWFAKWFEARMDKSPSEDQCRIHARMVVEAMERLRASRRMD